MKKNWFVVTILTMVFLAILSGCGGAENETPSQNNTQENVQDNAPADNSGGAEEDVDSLAVGDMTFPGFSAASLDPAIAAGDEAVLEVSGLIYDRLVNFEGGEITPGLAESWTVSDDGLTYQFKLRANASFIDGTKIETDVVLANFNRWFDPENPLHGDDSSVYTAWLENFDGFKGEMDADENPVSKFDGVEKNDNQEFLVHLNVPMDDFLEIISQPEFSILSSDALAADGELHATSEGTVVSSGKYYVINWDNSGLALAESTDYWGAME